MFAYGQRVQYIGPVPNGGNVKLAEKGTILGVDSQEAECRVRWDNDEPGSVTNWYSFNMLVRCT